MVPAGRDESLTKGLNVFRAQRIVVSNVDFKASIGHRKKALDVDQARIFVDPDLTVDGGETLEGAEVGEGRIAVHSEAAHVDQAIQTIHGRERAVF